MINLQKFIKRLIVFSGIKPSYLLSAINGCFDFGRWLRSHPIDKVFQTREDFYRYLNNSVLKNVPIDYLEFGVFQGNSLRFWSSTNEDPRSRFFGFDSFKGFPEDWQGVGSHVARNSFDLKGKTPDFQDERITLVRGYFQETVQEFLEKFIAQNRLVVSIDADIYSSTLFVLTSLARIFVPGTILVFDEFHLVCHEFRAFQDFTKSFLVNYKVLAATADFYERVAVEIL